MKYKIVGINPAYGKQPGDTVELDGTDPLVQLNVEGGVLLAIGTVGVMHCSACENEGRKRPTKLADQAEVDEHYGKSHPGLVAPEWKEEVN